MKIYIVKKGETLAKIAKKYNVSLEKLREINKHIKNVEKLAPGMKVKVPTAEIRLKPKQVTPVAEQRDADSEMAKFQPPVMESMESPSAIAQAPGLVQNEYAYETSENEPRQLTPPHYDYAPYGWSGGPAMPMDAMSPYMTNPGMYPYIQPYPPHPYGSYECNSCGGQSYSGPAYGGDFQYGYPWYEQPYSGSMNQYPSDYVPPYYSYPYPPYRYEGPGMMPAIPSGVDDRVDPRHESSSV